MHFLGDSWCWAFFHGHIDHLYVFFCTSVQIFIPFFNRVFYLLIELEGYLKWIGIFCLRRYCIYFFHSVTCKYYIYTYIYMYILCGYIYIYCKEQNILVSIYCTLLGVYVMLHDIYILSKKCLANSRIQKFSSVFFFQF